MLINNKEYNIKDIVEEIDISNNIPLKRENGLVLRNSWIEVLNKYNIDYKTHTSLKSLLFEIEEILEYDTDLEDLEQISEEIQEMNYYNYTNK